MKSTNMRNATAGSVCVSMASISNARPRYIFEIANEIRMDWKNVYFGAVPYLDAMFSLRTSSDRYGADDGRTIILYFLANASTYRGETARRIKKELKSML